MALKLYGTSEQAFRAKILNEANYAFKQLAFSKQNEFRNLFEDFLKSVKDPLTLGLDITLDAVGNLVSGTLNGVSDFFTSAEVMMKQFGADIAYDVDKDGRETVNDLGYALANQFLNATEGMTLWAGSAFAETGKFFLGTQFSEGFYGEGGVSESLKNWFDQQKADLRNMQLGSNIFKTTFTKEEVEANKDIINNSYSQSFLNEIKTIFEKSAASRQMFERMFSNEEVTRIIENNQSGAGFAQFTRGVAQSIGRMLPSIVLATITGKITADLPTQTAKIVGSLVKLMSNLYFAGSVFGQSMEEAINNGANYDDALTYAYGSALSEMVIENVSGVVIGEGITVNSFIDLFKQALSEAGEEAVAEIGAVGFKRAALGEKALTKAEKEENAGGFLSRVFMSALSGAVSGGILGVGNVLRANYTPEGRAEFSQKILQQNIEKMGAKQFAELAAPKVQQTLDDLQGTKLTQEQKDDIFFRSPALSKVITRTEGADGKVSFELSKAGQRLMQGEVIAFQGKKSISAKEYAMSNDLYLEELTESFDAEDEQGNPIKVKVKILEKQEVSKLDQATQQKIQETLDDFDNVIFVEMDESYNSYVDPETGAVYININAADKADGFRALYAHEIHDYIRSLREQGKLEPQAAKAYDRFIKLLTNEKSREALLDKMPKEMVAVIRQVTENYSLEEQPREFASFFIQKILAAKEGGIKGLETLLAAKEGGFLNFLRIFTNETILSRLIKQFGKSQDLKTLLEGLDRAFGAAIAQSKEVLTKKNSIVFANQYLQNLLVMGDQELETQPQAAKLAFSLAQKYPILNAMVEDSQDAVDFLKDEFTEKFQSIFLAHEQLRITEDMKQDNQATAEQIRKIIKTIKTPKENYLLNGFVNESILYFGQDKIIAVLEKMASMIEKGAYNGYFETALEQMKDEILDALQVKVFDLESKERKAGFIFSSRNVYFAKEDFEPFLKQNENRIYQPRFNFVHNTMEITHIFRTEKTNSSMADMFFRKTNIGGNIVDENLRIKIKNPLILGSVLNQQALSFLLNNNFLGAQSFSINNYGALDSTLGFFTDALRPSVDFAPEGDDFQIGEDPEYIVKIILNPSVISQQDTIVGKDDLYAPTRQFDHVLSQTYKLKYQQAGEKNNLSDDMGLFSYMDVFAKTIDYVIQNRVLYGLPADVKNVTERNFNQVKMSQLIPDDSKYLNMTLDRISMSTSLARKRANELALKKDINDANYFYNTPNVDSIIENLANSIETIKTAILGGELDADEFVAIIRELIYQGIHYLGDSNQNTAFEGRQELQKKYQKFKKEFNVLAYTYHFYNYQTTYIAEGRTQIYPENIEVVHLTRFKNKKPSNANYEKTIEWAKQNRIKVLETVDVHGAEDASFDHTRVPMRQTNDYLLERSKTKRIFLSKAGYKVADGQDISMDYREAMTDLEGKMVNTKTALAQAFDSYSPEIYLRAYGVSQKDRTNQELNSLAKGIKNTLTQVISRELEQMEKEERLISTDVFLAIDTFLQLEFSPNLSSITNKLKQDVSTFGVFEKAVKQTITNNLQVLREGGISLEDYVYNRRNNEMSRRGDVLRIVARIYKAYTEAFVTGVSTNPNYQSVVQNVLPNELENIKQFNDAFFSDDRKVRRAIGMYKSNELSQTTLQFDYILKDLSPEKFEELNSKLFTTSPVFKDNAKEGLMKDNEALSRMLYEKGYDFGFSYKKHAFAFKTSDFNVGENEAIGNIRYVNVSGFAPAFSYTVYVKNGDRLEYATDRMVYGAYVTVEDNALTYIIPNPMIIEFGTSYDNAIHLLSQNKIYAQSASVSPLASEISTVTRYAHNRPIGDLGWIKVRFYVDPVSLNRGNNILLPNDGWFADRQQTTSGVYLAVSTYTNEKQKPVSERQGSVLATTEDQVRKYDMKLATLALSNIVISNEFKDSSFAVDADDFGTYVNMNAIEGFVKLVASTGMNETKKVQTIQEIKQQIENSLDPEYRTSYFALVDYFYEVYSDVFNEFKTNDAAENRALVSAFGSLVQAYYEQNKGNYKVMAGLMTAFTNKNYQITREINQKYGSKIANIAKVIDKLPFRTNNTNEVRYNALDVQDIKVMQVDLMAREENIEAIQNHPDVKKLIENAKQKGIQVVLVNQSKGYQSIRDSADKNTTTLEKDIVPGNINKDGTLRNLLSSDLDYLDRMQSIMGLQNVSKQVEASGKAAATRYLVNTKLMFSKSQRIKNARQKKSREVMEQGKGRIIEQSIVPSTFQDPKSEAPQTQVKFDTSLSKLDVKSNLYKVLVRNVKTLKMLLEFQKDKNFKKQYPAESAVISRAITDLNRQKARLENLLGVKEPISPYDPNLEQDKENTEVEGLREALAEYRKDISDLYKAKAQTNAVMTRIESVLVQAIDKLDKEANTSKEAINPQGEVAVKPTTALEIEDVAKDLAQQPAYKHYLHLLSGLKQVNKLLDSSFALMDSNIRQALGKFKLALEKEISRMLNASGIRLKDPLNTNISALEKADPYFTEEQIKSIQKSMFDMTSSDIKNNYTLLLEKRQKFTNMFEKMSNELEGLSETALQLAQENATITVEQETKQIEEEQKVIDGPMVERKLVKGELAYVLRKLVDSRERALFAQLDNSKTPEEQATINKLLGELRILRRTLKKIEVKLSDDVFKSNKDTISKIRKDFENTKSLDLFMQVYGDLLKTKEPAAVSNEKTAKAREVAKQEKAAKEPYKQKYNGPVYVTIDDLNFSPGINSVLGKIIFTKPKALSKGKTILVKPAGQTTVYKPNTRKQQDQINGQVYVVEKARTALIKAIKALESNKTKTIKDLKRLQEIVENRKKDLENAEKKLEKIKRELDIVESIEQTPAITRTVGQKIYVKQGVQIEIPNLKITKYFFNLIKAFDYINGEIHTEVLKQKKEGKLPENAQPVTPIETPTAASTKEVMPLQPLLNNFAVPNKPQQEAPVLPTQKPAQMWIPTENVTVVFGEQAYTLTPQEVKDRIAKGDWNFSSEEQYVQYQKLVLQTMAEQAQKKAQDAKMQQAVDAQTIQPTLVGNQNLPALAQGINFFKQAQVQATINQPNQYELNEARWQTVIPAIEERLQNSKSKDDQRLYSIFLRLKQIIMGYRTDNRMYNHMSMAVAKVVIEEFDKFARLSSKGKVYIPSNADLQNVIDRVNGAIFAVLEYIDTNLLVKVNVSPENPKGYLYWKGSYWYFRGMKDVKVWDKTQTDAFNNDSHGNAYRRLMTALFNFNSKGFGMLELIAALEDFDKSTAVAPVVDMAIDGQAARTAETTVEQWVSDAKTNEEINAGANFEIKPAISAVLDPYTIAEIVGQFDEKSWAMTLMNKIVQAQERGYEVDRVFEEVFPEEWQKQNQPNLIELEKNTKPIANLGGTSVPMSQIMYLRNMLLREIVRNRMIDIGVIKGEKTHHFDNGNKVDILAITEIKEKKQRNKVVATIVDQNALLQELDSIINQDTFAKSYNEKVYEFMRRSYPLINERFKELQGANLVNDGETIQKAIPTMSQTQLQKLKDILPQGMQTQEAANLYIPILLTSGSYFKAQKLNFKDILDLGVFDGMVSNLTDTNGIVSVESITNVLTTYEKEVKNYYGFHRVARDLNLILNTAMKDEESGQTVFLERLLPKWAVEYFQRVIMDAAGYGQVESVGKWLPLIRRNFYTSAIGLNIKVVITQFASFLNLWNIYGQSDVTFLGRMIKNLAAQAAPSQKAVLENMAKNNLHYWNRSKGGTFEIGEATQEGMKAKSIIETLREFSMKGITLTDNMINKAFYLTLLESVNPDTNQNYTPEEANKVLTMGILRTQSTKAAIGKAEILRSKNELVRIMVKFLGEPLKTITQVYSSGKNIELIQKLKKNQNRIENNVNARIAVQQVKVDQAKAKLLGLQSVENSQTFATESEEFQQTTRSEIERAKRELQEAQERLKLIQESGKRTLERVSKVIASERKVRRLGQGRITAMITTINFLALLGFGFDMVKSGGGERDKERDEELWAYMMKKLGGRYMDEIMGMIPFARDVYGAFKGYDFGSIGEFQSVNAVTAQLGNIFRAIAEGENINWNRTVYNLAVGVGNLLGIPVKSIEGLFTTPLYYFNEPAFYQYNNFIGGQDRDNIELAQAIKEDDLAMISVIVDRKIQKRNIKIHIDVKNEIKALIRQGFDISIVGIPDKVTEDGVERKLTAEEKADFAEVYSKADSIVRKLLTSAQYRRLTGKYKARLIQAVYNYYYKYAKQDVLGIDTLSEDLTFTSLNEAYTYFLGRVEAYRKQQVKDADRNVPTISLLN